jgi:major type 1 subunit fimbrin (pilin)
VGTTVWTSPTITLPAMDVACSGQAYGVVATQLAASGVANVYQTGISYLGVKIVEVTSFTTVNTTPARWSTPPLNFSGSMSPPSYQVSLVVIGPVPNSNSSSSINVPIAQDYISDSPTSVSGARELHRLQLASFGTQVTGGTPCAAANVAVSLGTHAASEFTSALGSTTAGIDFPIRLTNCPAGMNRIAYQIDPTTAIVPNTGNTVVVLSSGSTATGVGVQLLDPATGAPLALMSQQTIAASGGTYTINLRARYYRTTTAPIGGGSANAAMTFTITYN